MNASFESLQKASIATGREQNPPPVSASDETRRNIESLLDQSHAVIQDLEARLGPVLRPTNKAADDTAATAAVTSMHGWLINREDSIRAALRHLFDLVERLEI